MEDNRRIVIELGIVMMCVVMMLTGCSSGQRLVTVTKDSDMNEVSDTDGVSVVDTADTDRSYVDTNHEASKTASDEADVVAGEASGSDDDDMVTGETNDSYDGDTECDESIKVHVCGAVINPGVYELSSDGRVYDALMAAGGFTDEADTETINLAAQLYDGQQIYFPTVQEVLDGYMADASTNVAENSESAGRMPASGGGTGVSDNSSDAGTDTDKVNINTATRDELMTLTGIGETRADAIISYRESVGGFDCVEDIMNVSGIKSGTYDKFKDNITVR